MHDFEGSTGALSLQFQRLQPFPFKTINLEFLFINSHKVERESIQFFHPVLLCSGLTKFCSVLIKYSVAKFRLSTTASRPHSGARGHETNSIRYTVANVQFKSSTRHRLCINKFYKRHKLHKQYIGPAPSYDHLL